MELSKAKQGGGGEGQYVYKQLSCLFKKEIDQINYTEIQLQNWCLTWASIFGKQTFKQDLKTSFLIGDKKVTFSFKLQWSPFQNLIHSQYEIVTG